jgi:prepilin-type N-terminal cleavage/methylation domain-containing protein
VSTERTAREAGFTLIEVLVAMVILSVGLLGLEALGIGAARSVVKADDQTRMATAATRVMEEKQQAVHRAPGAVSTGEQCGTDSESGLYLCSDVQTRLSSAGLAAHSSRITVRVARSSDGPFFTVTSYVFEPALP